MLCEKFKSLTLILMLFVNHIVIHYFDRLHSQQPSYGPTCCLVKRWLSAHLLDNSHIPDIVVELLVASMYLTPDPYKPAQTPQVAFLRFLELFARDHWSTEPIFVNFNNELTRNYSDLFIRRTSIISEL